MNQDLLNKIQEVADEAYSNETHYAFWRGKINETDEFEYKIQVDYNPETLRFQIRAGKR